MNSFEYEARMKRVKHQTLIPFEIEYTGSKNDFNPQKYYRSFDNNISFFVALKACLFLGLTNFGTYDKKEQRLCDYFVFEQKILCPKSYHNLYQICNLIPGATSTQLVAAVVLVKTKNVIYSLFGTLIFILPGIILSVGVCFLYHNFIGNFHPELGTKLLYDYFYFYCNKTLQQISIGFILSFLTYEMRKIFLSNFHLGLVIISAIILLISHKIIPIAIMYIACGFLSSRNRESEFLIEKTCDDVEELISSSSSWSFIGLPSLITYLIFLILCIIFLFFRISDGEYQSFFIYTYFSSSMPLVDYSIIDFYSIFVSDSKVNVILIAFSVVCLLQGNSFNFFVVITLLQADWSLVKTVEVTIVSYLPSILFLLFFVKLMPILNNEAEYQFILKGMKSANIGFLLAILPKLFHSAVIESRVYNYFFGSFLILLSWGFFYMKMMWFGVFVCLLIAFILCII